MAKAASYCPACGPAQMSHLSLWLSNTSDVLALRFQGVRDAKPLRLFSAVGEGALWAISRAFYYLASLLGIATLRDDIEKARSRRSRLLWEEARRRCIPMRQLFLFGAPTDLFEVRMNGRRHFIQSIPFPPAPHENTLAVDDKVAFKRLMREAGLPVPKSRSVRGFRKAKEALAEYEVVCVKPQSGSNSRHTYPHVKTQEDLAAALRSATEICAFASVEEHLEGNLARATAIDGKLVGFLESYSPAVTGDGSATIAELVERLNAALPQGVDRVLITESHEHYVRRRGYGMNDVLPMGLSLPLTYRAGSAQGGGNREYGRAIHSSFIPIIEEAARLMKVPIVGFDLIIPDPLSPADSQKWGFIEANTLPWIDLHSAPLYGEPINLAPAVWDLWGKDATP